MSTQASNAITVFIVDDHPLFMAGVRGFLNETDDVTVVGATSSGAKAVALIAACKPDVAVLDISMPDIDGMAVAAKLAQRAPSTQVIMLSAFDEQGLVNQAIRAGARGYVVKRSACDNLLFAIRAVRNGGFYIDPAIASRMMPSIAHERRNAAPAPSLTPRETEVLRLIAMGFTIKEAAARLGVTTKSVETYKIRASEKMQLRSRAKIVQFAMGQGWFQEGADDGPRARVLYGNETQLGRSQEALPSPVTEGHEVDDHGGVAAEKVGMLDRLDIRGSLE